MFDQDTITVTYNRERGEGRGPRSKKLSTDELSAKGLGDCIDCSLCVQVCPTGIDIRNGLQYECINCGACVDACNDVMLKMNYPQDLISFTAESTLAGAKVNFFRPKVLGYLFVCIIIICVMTIQFKARTELELDVVRDRNSLYRENNQGAIENTYTLVLINKSQSPMTVDIKVNGLSYTSLIGVTTITLAPDELLRHPVSVIVDPTDLKQAVSPVEFAVETNGFAQASYTVKQKSTFIYQ